MESSCPEPDTHAPPASSPAFSPRAKALLGAIVLLGLGLRIWSARGGLWVDEAWSAVMVERARTPLGIFVAINHDNNHHLNSLWMLLCGYGAPPMALRALSIASGTAAILLASAIGARRSNANAVIAALLFAVSPMMVNYGSEARGYMPMLLALMMMIWLVSRWLDTPGMRPPAWPLAALAAVGLLSQLTMVFGLAALMVWVAVRLARSRSIPIAETLTTRLFLPSAIVTAAVFAIVLGAAIASPTGMQVGDYGAFSLGTLWSALRVMVAASFGGLAVPAPVISLGMIAIVIGIAIVLRRNDPLAIFYLAAVVGLPATLAVLRIGNTGIPRYFLLSSVAMMLMVAGLLARGLTGHRATRAACLVVIPAIVVGCLYDDVSQAALRRGDSGAAIATMTAMAPSGASVLVEHLRPVATLRVAAAEAGYPLRIVDRCPAAMFLHVDLADGTSAPRSAFRCGRAYRLLVVRTRSILSGTSWALYGRADAPGKRAEILP
jgi:hypothetical protein